VAQYFDEQPEVTSRTQVIDVSLGDVAYTMLTDRGVFSHGHLDTGTSLLLREAPSPASIGDVLDLGCGSGAIALALVLRSPKASVWAIDVNERARRLTSGNAERNGLRNVRVVAPEDLPDGVRFSTIWSNPPIRIGKAALHELLLRWLARLTDDGCAVLVVQKHLGADSLQRWLIAQGFVCERIASRAGFRLLRCRREHALPGPVAAPDPLRKNG
jgi:16S rRNA (guanine1207-N2)-methyltransferase